MPTDYILYHRKYEAGEVDTGELMFDCPGCGCAHSVTTKGKNESGAQWRWNGSEDRPTFEPSVHVTSNGQTVCHLFVRAGKLQYLGDCKHQLKGQTIDMKPF